MSMRKLPLKTKFALVIGVPTVVVMLLATVLAIKTMTAYSSALETQDGVRIADLAASVVHEMQVERGRTAVFFGGGDEGGSVLGAQFERTDTAVDAFREGMEAMEVPEEMSAPVEDFERSLERIAQLRSTARSRDTSAIRGYTELNHMGLELVDTVSASASSPTVTRYVAALAALGRAKEQAGLARAKVSMALSGRGGAGLLGQIHRLAGDQRSYLERFRALAAEEDRSRFDRLASSPSVTTPEGMRDALLAGEDSLPSVEEWFAAQTGKIDAFRGEEAEAVETIEEVAAENASSAFSILALSLVGSFFLLVVVGVLAWRVLAAIRASLFDLQTAADKIAVGDMSAEVVVETDDELGQLAESFGRTVKYVQHYSAGLDALSRGEDVRFDGHVEDDDLGVASSRLVTVLDDLEAQLNEFRNELRGGNLGYRVDVSRFSGTFRDLAEGMNGMAESVATPIADLTGALDQLARDKDLTVKVSTAHQGAFGKVADSFNRALGQLDEALSQASAAADQVRVGAGEISIGNQSLAQAASDRASTLEEVTSSLQQVTSLSEKNAARSADARQLTEGAWQAAENGVATMAHLSEAMNGIKSAADETAKIVQTIDEIAFQTNLLALNAAVEAARAGEAGKGFAVVAEEVRALAQRSAEAARQTSAMIDASIEKSNSGVSLNRQVLERLADIKEQVGQVQTVMDEITGSSQAQAEGVRQINDAVDDMARATQRDAATTEETASVAEELSGQSQALRSMMAKFSLATSAGASPAMPAAPPPSMSMPMSQPMPTMSLNSGSNRDSARPAPSAQSAHEMLPFEDIDHDAVLTQF
ncbi:MAG: nitrate- and nitrite sensing domain-containing protein [Myxococcota bacterium]